MAAFCAHVVGNCTRVLPRAGTALSRSDRAPARGAGPALHGSRSDRAGHRILATCRCGEFDCSAHQEAIGHFGRALEILGAMPEGEARDRKELDVAVALPFP